MFSGYFIQIESITCDLLYLAFADWHNASEVHPWCNLSCYFVLFDLLNNIPSCCCCCSVAKSCPALCDPMDCSMPGFPVHHQPLKPAQTDVYRIGYPTIPSSVVPFFSCLQSFPASRSFPVSQLFTSGGQIIEVSASRSVHPMNIHDWFPLGLTGLISLQSKELSRVFSNTTVQKHQFFGAQLSL